MKRSGLKASGWSQGLFSYFVLSIYSHIFNDFSTLNLLQNIVKSSNMLHKFCKNWRNALVQHAFSPFSSWFCISWPKDPIISMYPVNIYLNITTIFLGLIFTPKIRPQWAITFSSSWNQQISRNDLGILTIWASKKQTTIILST